MSKKIRTLLLILFSIPGFLIVAFWGLVIYVDKQLANTSHDQFYNDCHKVWSNRGLVTEGRVQNSIASVKNAFMHQAKGVEVDHFYDPGLGRFIVSHDFPYRLKDGKLLTLEELFSAVDSPDHYYWLDFKKLRKLKDEQVYEAIARLNQIAGSNDLKQRIYVEGEDPFHLAYVRDAGFNTIFDTHPIPDRFPLSGFVINVYKIVYYFGEYSVFGIPYSYHGDPIFSGENQKTLANVPVFVYHVDEPKLIEGIVMDPAVRVALNNSHSIDNFQTNVCK